MHASWVQTWNSGFQSAREYTHADVEVPAANPPVQAGQSLKLQETLYMYSLQQSSVRSRFCGEHLGDKHRIPKFGFQEKFCWDYYIFHRKGLFVQVQNQKRVQWGPDIVSQHLSIFHFYATCQLLFTKKAKKKIPIPLKCWEYNFTADAPSDILSCCFRRRKQFSDKMEVLHSHDSVPDFSPPFVDHFPSTIQGSTRPNQGSARWKEFGWQFESTEQGFIHIKTSSILFVQCRGRHPCFIFLFRRITKIIQLTCLTGTSYVV